MKYIIKMTTNRGFVFYGRSRTRIAYNNERHQKILTTKLINDNGYLTKEGAEKACEEIQKYRIYPCQVVGYELE